MVDHNNTVETIVYGQISQLLCAQTDWTDEQRVEALSHYMKVSVN